MGRRRRNPDIQHYPVSLRRMIGHRKRAEDIIFIGHVILPQVKAIPVIAVLLLHVKVFEIGMVRRNINLNVLTRLKLNGLSFFDVEAFCFRPPQADGERVVEKTKSAGDLTLIGNG